MPEAIALTAGAVGAEFRVGAAFRRTFGILSRQFLKFVALTAIATLPNLVIDRLPGAGFGAFGSALAQMLAGIWLIFAVGFSTAVIVHAAFQDMRGRTVSIGQSLRTGLGRVLPVIGTVICMTVAGGLAAVLFIVPGIMVWMQVYVSIPSCVVERLGPIKSMGRSARLTEHHRWRIFGIVVLTTVVSGGVAGVIRALIGDPVAAFAASLATYVWQTIFNAFDGILVVVIYHDLRVVKEGIDIERIAAVFD